MRNYWLLGLLLLLLRPARSAVQERLPADCQEVAINDEQPSELLARGHGKITFTNALGDTSRPELWVNITISRQFCFLNHQPDKIVNGTLYMTDSYAYTRCLQELAGSEIERQLRAGNPLLSYDYLRVVVDVTQVLASGAYQPRSPFTKLFVYVDRIIRLCTARVVVFDWRFLPSDQANLPVEDIRAKLADPQVQVHCLMNCPTKEIRRYLELADLTPNTVIIVDMNQAGTLVFLEGINTTIHTLTLIGPTNFPVELYTLFKQRRGIQSLSFKHLQLLEFERISSIANLVLVLSKAQESILMSVTSWIRFIKAYRGTNLRLQAKTLKIHLQGSLEQLVKKESELLVHQFGELPAKQPVLDRLELYLNRVPEAPIITPDYLGAAPFLNWVNTFFPSAHKLRVYQLDLNQRTLERIVIPNRNDQYDVPNSSTTSHHQ